jgi:hypothetical protein
MKKTRKRDGSGDVRGPRGRLPRATRSRRGSRLSIPYPCSPLDHPVVPLFHLSTPGYFVLRAARHPLGQMRLGGLADVRRVHPLVRCPI